MAKPENNIRLGDICTIVDCEHKTAPLEVEGYPSIRTPNIGKGRLILDPVNRVSERTYQLWTRRAIPKAGDLIMAREAPVGNVAIIPKDLKVCLGQRTVLIQRESKEIDSSFLNYLLNSQALNALLLSLSNGATVGHLNVADIRKLPLPKLPSLKVQQKIAAVLSAYDDLIENNNRRIALLEKMAEELYREWFVRMRFPGYKKAKFAKGKPVGWEERKLPELAHITYGFPFEGSRFNSEGIGHPIVRIRNIPDSATSDYTDQEAAEKYLINTGDILVGMDGEFHINHWSNDPAYLVQRVCKIVAKQPILYGYIFNAIKAPIKHFEAILMGATVGHLGAKHLNSMYILCPPKEVVPHLQAFNDLYSQKVKIFSANLRLKQSRDMFLSRLISGKLSVEHLDIQFPPSMEEKHPSLAEKKCA